MEEKDRIATTDSPSQESVVTPQKSNSENTGHATVKSLRQSRSVDIVSVTTPMEAIDSDSGDGLFRRSRPSFMLSAKQKNHHKSIELLHSRQLTSKNLEMFEGSGDPTSAPLVQKNQRQSYFGSRASMNGLDGEKLTTSPSSTNLSETTGYRSGRTTSNDPNVETVSIRESRIKSPNEQTAPYTAISTLRNTRMSAMLLRSNSKSENDVVVSPEKEKERDRTESAKPANPKSFKEWYSGMILKYEKSMSGPRPDKKNVPSMYSLETIFGKKGDLIDPYDRIMWMAECYGQIQTAVIWTVPPQSQPQSPTAESIVVSSVDPTVQREDGVVIDTSTPGLRMVTSGIVVDLIEALVFPADQDMSFAQVFFATYRNILAPKEVFDSLVKYFSSTKKDSPKTEGKAGERTRRLSLFQIQRQVQSRVIRLLVLWITHHWQDFSTFQDSLDNFVDTLSADHFSSFQKLTHAIREQKLVWFTYMYVPMFSHLRVSNGEPIDWEFTLEGFVNQITMVDHLFFRKWKPDVYFRVLHKPCEMEHGAYDLNLRILMEWASWFRLVVGYVVTMVQMEETTKKRTAMIKDFIKCGKLCMQMGNFNACFAITYALRMPAAIIWISAWEAIPSKYLEIYKELLNVCDPSNGFANYISQMQIVGPPAIPFILPYMQDLLEVDQSQSSSGDDEVDFLKKRVNFEKHYHLFSIAAELETFRLTPYTLPGDRESNSVFVQHLKRYSRADDVSLGVGSIFSTGKVIDNQQMTSAAGLKAVKKIVALLQE